MKKNIRCIVCRTLFTMDELKDSKGCPICGYEGITMLTKTDLTVDVNWLELKIICMWAEQFGLQGADQHSINAFYGIVKSLQDQIPKFDNLTLYTKANVVEGLDESPAPQGTKLN